MAKIIIDLEERLEEYVDNYINIGGYDEERKKPLYCYPDRLVKTIKDGIVLSEKITNGDIIKAVFSGEKFELDEYNDEYGQKHEDIIMTKINSDVRFEKDWWDSPYKEVDHEVYNRS